MLRTAKGVSALFMLAVILGGFVYFAPVVSLGATPTVTETFSMRVPQPTNATAPLGSISFCLFGNGAVLVNGTYYPNVEVNQTVAHACGKG